MTMEAKTSQSVTRLNDNSTSKTEQDSRSEILCIAPTKTVHIDATATPISCTFFEDALSLLQSEHMRETALEKVDTPKSVTNPVNTLPQTLVKPELRAMITKGIPQTNLCKPTSPSTNVGKPAAVLSKSTLSATPRQQQQSVVVRPANNTIARPAATPLQVHGLPFNYEKFKRYKNIATNAYNQRKIFSIIGGYQSVRRALLRRGWQERLLEGQYRSLQDHSHHSLLEKATAGNDYEMAAISKLLQPYPSFFIWYPRNMTMTRFDQVLPFKSRLKRNREFDFTLKEGLVNCNRERHWHYIPNRSELNCPRSYRLMINDETEEFMRDYRFTGCTSLLAWLVDGKRPDGKNERFAAEDGGTVNHSCIEFALRRIREGLRVHYHDDVDGFTPETLESAHWREFFKSFHAVVRMGEKFVPMTEIKNRQTQWEQLLASSKQAWPDMETDGFMNVWIVKPVGQSRGIGISVMQDNLRIVEWAEKNKQRRFIVQKYLERPLLIYKTKFDIRQYFLMVGRSTSVQVWMYKACYLKFSSQEFSLHNFHESVHLTNHFVQKNYTNSANRSAMLPECNMWSSLQFQVYLDTIGHKDAWMKRIYPAMKRNVVAAVRCAYEDCNDLERNCFELVGADFMVTDRFEVQLLEVNATPDMFASTPVTRQICADCLEDVVKVIVDRNQSANAPTGNFELIYEVPILRGQSHLMGAGTVDICTPKPQHFLPLATPSPSQNLAQPMSTPPRQRSHVLQPQTITPSMTPELEPKKKTPIRRNRPVQAITLSTNSKQILEDLCGRLLRSNNSPKHRIMIKSGGQQPPKSIDREMNRLMQLNQTIERLLHSRSKNVKYRQNIINKFLATRQLENEATIY